MIHRRSSLKPQTTVVLSNGVTVSTAVSHRQRQIVIALPHGPIVCRRWIPADAVVAASRVAELSAYWGSIAVSRPRVDLVSRVDSVLL